MIIEFDLCNDPYIYIDPGWITRKLEKDSKGVRKMSLSDLFRLYT